MRNNHISIYGIFVLTAVFISSYACATAQNKVTDNLHLTIDWQLNAPLNTDFADKISGWGMNFEGTYDITSHWTVGGFINFHTNHKYIDRSFINLSPTETMSTDRQQSAFKLPFGVTAAYDIIGSGHFRPYVGVKTGAMFARCTTYYNIYGYLDKSWGYYVSPEIGIRIYPSSSKHFGFHIAAYYDFATNKAETIGESIDNRSNIGLRAGIFF